MKYTLKAILTLILGCLTHSCLDLDPKDQIADGNYWNSVTDYKLFANQFYSWTRDFSNSVYDAPHSDKRSDLIVDKGGTNVYSNGKIVFRLQTIIIQIITTVSVVRIYFYRKPKLTIIRLISHSMWVKRNFSVLTAILSYCNSMVMLSSLKHRWM